MGTVNGSTKITSGLCDCPAVRPSWQVLRRRGRGYPSRTGDQPGKIRGKGAQEMSSFPVIGNDLPALGNEKTCCRAAGEHSENKTSVR